MKSLTLIAAAVLALGAASTQAATSCGNCGDKPAAKTVAKTAAKTAAKKNAAAPIVCPVMGNKIASADKAAGKSVYKGKTYYFCCPACKPMFDKDPAKYAKAAPAPKSPKAGAHKG